MIICSRMLNTNVTMLKFTKRFDSSYNGKKCNKADPKVLTFSDTEIAFRSKTNLEILRALFVLKLCSNKWLVERNKQVMKWTRRVVGKTIFRNIMKMTFYGHFVAGETESDVTPICKRMREFGVESILDYSVEADLSKKDAVETGLKALTTQVVRKNGEHQNKYAPHMDFMDRREGVSSARTYFYEGEPECDRNADRFCESIDQAAMATGEAGFVAIKLTALGRPQFLLQMSSVIEQAQQFYWLLCGCGWEDYIESKISQDQLRDKLNELGIKTDETALNEWFKTVTFDKDGFVDIFEWSKLFKRKFSLSKLLKVVNLSEGKMNPLMTQLSEDEEQQFRNMMDRLNKIVRHAVDRGVRLMVDAEQSYFQPAISRLTLEMMRQYNKTSPCVFNTYQCYLKNSLNNIKLDLMLSRREGFCFGAKLVRGAYMEQERKRAAELGYEDPINVDFETTSKMYNEVVKAVISEAIHQQEGDIQVLCGTHNEESIKSTVAAMHAAGIRPEQKTFSFGQLYGMSDHISYTLGQEGYRVYKYVPYGPVEDVLPYLSRRAIENSGVVSKASKERNLLWTELKRRFDNGQYFNSQRPSAKNMVGFN